MYDIFAAYYDQLTGNVDYEARAQYFDRLIRSVLVPADRAILLDLGCGTGSLSICMDQLGYDVIGVDGSAGMLSVALSKTASKIRWICQDFASLDLYGTVDVTVCALDCLNHITKYELLKKSFERVSLFTRQGGLFLFDVNTPYKHREVLGNNTFVYDLDELYCVWQNATDIKTLTTDIALDFFVAQGKNYLRQSEQFSERCWTPTQLEQLLRETGFTLLAVYAGDSERPLGERDERAVFLAQKTAPTGRIRDI